MAKRVLARTVELEDRSTTDTWSCMSSPPKARKPNVQRMTTTIPELAKESNTKHHSSQQGTPSYRPTKPPASQRWKPLMQSSTNTTEYSGMLLQPDSSPISEAQLAAEIQGIYDGVVTVELKCIDIDAALARDSAELGLEQWQALIALHRTLLYEHHDFLMATQHPSASEKLKALASKYSMPARMWKHGIHAFLEVLRHRRPESEDYMLAFVVLAYQMMATLYETVPCFTDTWIECLGDLARYRMVIEDDCKETWAGVAARWYTLASDRHPDIGRLYHHLGILERPSMRKLSLYAKSLTCSISFLNARDSMPSFCTPIVREEHLFKPHPEFVRLYHEMSILGRPNMLEHISFAFLKDLERYDIDIDDDQKSQSDWPSVAAPSGLPGAAARRNANLKRLHDRLRILEWSRARKVGRGLRWLLRHRSDSKYRPKRPERQDMNVKDGLAMAHGSVAFASGFIVNDFHRSEFPDLRTVPNGNEKVRDQQCLTGQIGQDPEPASLPSRGSFAWLKLWTRTSTWRRVVSFLIAVLQSGTLPPLLLASCLPTTMALPLGEPSSTLDPTPHLGFMMLVWLLVPLAIGSLCACWVFHKPVEKLEISLLLTSFDIASGGTFLVAQSVNDSDSTTNMFVLGCWSGFCAVGTATRYRLTTVQYQDRYCAVVFLGGALAAFVTSAVIAMGTGDMSAHHVAELGLNLLPLGLSCFECLCYTAWMQSGRESAVPVGEGPDGGPSAGTALELSNYDGSREYMRSLYQRGSVSVDDSTLEEQPWMHNPVV